jgi:hypothetical protein
MCVVYTPTTSTRNRSNWLGMVDPSVANLCSAPHAASEQNHEGGCIRRSQQPLSDDKSLHMRTCIVRTRALCFLIRRSGVSRGA